MSVLTVNSIKGLKPKDKPYYVWDGDGQRGRGKLGVQVTPRGAKRFTYRFFWQGKPQFLTLGQFPESSLQQMRELQKQYGDLLIQGTNPKEYLEQLEHEAQVQKKEEARKGTIKQLFHSYTAQMKKDSKRTYQATLNALEKEVYPHISFETKARDVKTEDLILVLASMIKRGAVTQSNRVRSYLMAAFNYGLKHDNDPANYIEEAKFGLTYNPVSGIPKQKDAEKVGDHYMSWEELTSLLNDLKNVVGRFRMGEDMRHLLLLCFYTGGQRPYELSASRWENVNWNQATLMIPPELSKNKRPHLVPLTETAIEVMRKQYAISGEKDFIFPHKFDDERPIRTDSLAQAINRYRNSTPDCRPFVARDIRRTCKTLMGELGIDKSIRDRLQNHALNDVSSKHYDRYEYLPEKRRAVEIWERKLNVEQAKPIDNVVKLVV